MKGFEVRAAGAGAELLIFGESGFEVSAADVVSRLTSLDGVDLLVRVNSYGGDAYEGVAIANALRGYVGSVTTVVEGLAASAASVIAVGGGDRVVIRPSAEVMIHDAWSFSDGDAEELRKRADRLDQLSGSIAEVYARKAGTPVEMWREAMRSETWFSADEALSAGLVDAVEDARDTAVVSARADARVARTFNYAGQRFAPTPSLGALTGRREGDKVSFVADVASRLGMTESTDDPEKVLAALAEALGEVNDEVVETVPPVDEVEGEPAGDDEVAGGDAEVGDDVEGDESSDDDDDDEGDDEVDDKVEVDPVGDTVVIDADVYRELLDRAARGDSADEAEAERRAGELVSAAIRDGKVLGAKRDGLVKAAIEDYAATKAHLDSLASGTIPVAEKGRGGSDESRGASVENNRRRARPAGRFGPPVV